MRNMLQLLGGVAVAGAVAAGTTAFTASGFAQATALNTGIAGGGATSFNVNAADAKLMSALLVHDATESDRITGVNISMMKADGSTPILDASAGKIKVKFTGSTGTGTATWGACTADSGGSTDDGGFSCAVPGGYYTTISSVQIAYIP
nr:hypothetical protein [uncultured Actinoplanes sp.]